jgi:NADH:ubiquinone oxidoreductase subunit C
MTARAEDRRTDRASRSVDCHWSKPEHWLDVAFQLRDEPQLAFEQLIDLCGIDYLGYGDDEWETAEATGTGFPAALTPWARGVFPGQSGRRPGISQPLCCRGPSAVDQAQPSASTAGLLTG